MASKDISGNKQLVDATNKDHLVATNLSEKDQLVAADNKKRKNEDKKEEAIMETTNSDPTLKKQKNTKDETISVIPLASSPIPEKPDSLTMAFQRLIQLEEARYRGYAYAFKLDPEDHETFFEFQYQCLVECAKVYKEICQTTQK